MVNKAVDNRAVYDIISMVEDFNGLEFKNQNQTANFALFGGTKSEDGDKQMAAGRKTSAGIAKTASKIMSSKSYSSPARKVAASALSQRAPQPKRGKK